MPSGLMETSPGGEQTQYEGEHEASKPHKKAVGQFGNPNEGTTIDPSKRGPDPSAPNTQGVTPADKVRFGQSIQEGGAGGKTEGGLSGGANQEGGFGGTEALEGGKQDSFGKERRQQGYGGQEEMSRDIGA